MLIFLDKKFSTRVYLYILSRRIYFKMSRMCTYIEPTPEDEERVWKIRCPSIEPRPYEKLNGKTTNYRNNIGNRYCIVFKTNVWSVFSIVSYMLKNFVSERFGSGKRYSFSPFCRETDVHIPSTTIAESVQRVYNALY